MSGGFQISSIAMKQGIPLYSNLFENLAVPVGLLSTKQKEKDSKKYVVLDDYEMETVNREGNQEIDNDIYDNLLKQVEILDTKPKKTRRSSSSSSSQKNKTKKVQ